MTQIERDAKTLVIDDPGQRRRVDAVPYLYEREGTNCENLPETHRFLMALRHHIDEKFANRILLAEANQGPEDTVVYFGQGDECNMAFHFPLTPRMFMAIHLEDRFPIIDIMAQTPVIPESCQWCLFLRNHDELTLEMVTDEERDYMYRAYAADAQARINLGIRHRLAPLLGNNRQRIELMNALLFSLPGTPVLYYGDEIGMGDNIHLDDRDGIRTPMQWSADRNGGFSRTNPQKLYPPLIIDPEYHFESLNVEAQQTNSSSLLWWMKRLIAIRKRYPELSRGSIEMVAHDNHKILAFLRVLGERRVLCVFNLSRFMQHVELDMTRFIGMTPIELWGRTPFPVVNMKPYFLTLTPHSYVWLSLETHGYMFQSLFISYSHNDEVFAKKLYDRMRQLKRPVWYAPEDIEAGKKLHEQISEAISSHDRLLLVLSNDRASLKVFSGRRVPEPEIAGPLCKFRNRDASQVHADYKNWGS